MNNIIITDKDYYEKYTNLNIQNVQKGYIIFKGKYYYFSTKKIPTEVVTMFYKDFYRKRKEFSNKDTIIGKQKDLRCSKNCSEEKLFINASKIYDDDTILETLYIEEVNLSKTNTPSLKFIKILLKILGVLSFLTGIIRLLKTGSHTQSNFFYLGVFFSILYIITLIIIEYKNLKSFINIKNLINKI